MSNRFIQFRQKAIDWLNSDRDFNAGITLLEESKFKPGVVAKLKRHGVNGPEATKRLKFLISELIKAWAMTDQEIVEDAPALEIETQPEHTDQNSLSLVNAYQVLESGEHQYPDTVSQLIRHYADAYKKRDILHKKIADMPEDNEETTVAARKELSDQIAALSDEMEFLYPKYAAYSEKGVIPSEEDLIQPSSDESKDTSKDAAEQDYSKMSKEELQKLRKSVATKIGRAKNMLEFQQESKADAPNPMPECPKRVKYQTKIDNLSEELKKIEYAIAALG